MKAIHAIIILAIAAFTITGWVKNIIKLFDAGLDAGLTVESTLRIIGIPVAPLGVILGWFV